MLLRHPIQLGQPQRRRRPLRAFLLPSLRASAAAGWLRGHALPVPASLQPLLTRLHLLPPTPAEPAPAPAATSAAAPSPSPAAPQLPPPPADPLKQAGLELV